MEEREDWWRKGVLDREQQPKRSVPSKQNIADANEGNCSSQSQVEPCKVTLVLCQGNCDRAIRVAFSASRVQEKLQLKKKWCLEIC